MRGLGTDIIEISRIAEAIRKARFVQRVYTEAEQAYLRDAGDLAAQSAAGLFCAKEAVAKALGTGLAQGVAFADIEISHTAAGAPQAHVRGHEGLQILISISHCKDYATATALIQEGGHA
ncbi:holo-ACP synthase [Intestinibacillus massiliensis]|nr:holo-ACP synthase [Intestinibacillus massiliensis]